MFEVIRQHPAGPSPESARDLVRALHAGAVVALAPTQASRALVDAVTQELERDLDATTWAALRSTPAPYGRLARARAALGQGDAYRARIARVCAGLGLDPQTQVDAPRLRSITAGAERDPAAAPVYLLHRDTWYGCPQSLLVAWMPLHDVRARDVFAFYPDRFDRPVPNTSAAHDQAWWMDQVGWHGTTALENFAAPTRSDALGQVVRWDLPAGAIVLFSAAQLHQTWPNPTPGDTRFSVDFRILPVADTQAPNVDNDSAGAQARVDQELWPIADAL